MAAFTILGAPEWFSILILILVCLLILFYARRL